MARGFREVGEYRLRNPRGESEPGWKAAEQAAHETIIGEHEMSSFQVPGLWTSGVGEVSYDVLLQLV